MQQTTRKFLTLGGALAAICLLAVGAALSLLCWLTPSVGIVNNSQNTLVQVTLTLPSRTLDFGNLTPGSEQQRFYDADQTEGRYSLSAVVNGKSLHLSCGKVTPGEWGKRMQISVDDQAHVECKELHRY